MPQRSLFLLTCVLLSLLSPRAQANGRFPAANQLVLDPGNDQHLVLRATFGLLDSADGGSTWSWICEAAVGYGGEEDPAVVVLSDGSIAVATLNTLAESGDSGCSWQETLASARSEYPVDVSLDPADPTVALVLSTSVDGSGLVHLFELDAGAPAASELGSAVGTDFFPFTLDAAPSRGQRLYVTGLTDTTPPAAVLERSDDRGNTWQRFAIDPYATLPAYIAAIDPTDPGRLYVRIDDSPEDHLLVSSDAGETWTDALDLDGDMLGFALSPDGSHIAVGGPGTGIFVASSSELDFVPAGSGVENVNCLKWASAGLYACGDEATDGFTLGLSVDAGQTFSPLWHVQDLTPLACDASTPVGSLCADAWPAVATTIGASSAGVPSDAGTAGAANPAAKPASGEHPSSCALSRSTNPRTVPPWASSLVVALIWWRRRRTRSARDGRNFIAPSRRAAPTRRNC
jgi:photosystem II stability/assembly factor-like uncharacterized protein